MVSIIIPIRNRARLFGVTVNSLKQQTFSNWQAWVVDDRSSTEELAQIRSLIGNDDRFSLISNCSARHGASACRNYGFAASQSDYVLFLDADDALTPNCLERRLNALENDPTLDFVTAPVIAFRDHPGDSDILWNRFDDRDDLDRFCSGDSPWNTNSVLWRRSSLLSNGLHWKESAQSFQDWDFHIRAISLGLRYSKLGEPDCFWRFATTLGSIGSTSTTPSKAVNRVRILRDVYVFLCDHGKMTRRRRHALSLLFYRQTFESLQTHAHMLRIWRVGYKTGVVSAREYWSILAVEFGVRLGRRIARQIYPHVYPRFYSQSHYLRHRVDKREEQSNSSPAVN